MSTNTSNTNRSSPSLREVLHSNIYKLSHKIKRHQISKMFTSLMTLQAARTTLYMHTTARIYHIFTPILIT